MSTAPVVPDRIFDADELAALLHCAVTTIEERARRGDLPGLKIGEGWIFPAGALFQRLNELALEESTKRRQPPPPSHVIRSIDGPSTKRGKRTPPVWPKVP